MPYSNGLPRKSSTKHPTNGYNPKRRNKQIRKLRPKLGKFLKRFDHRVITLISGALARAAPERGTSPELR